MEQMTAYHVPVLLNESIDGLNVKPGGIYVDVTFGGGGHSREMLRRLGTGKGHLYGFDQDAECRAQQQRAATTTRHGSPSYAATSAT